MSSYLNIFLVPKEMKVRPLLLLSYNRNSDIYQIFKRSINTIFCGMDEIYEDLTLEKINTVIEYLQEEINRLESEYKTTYEIMHSLMAATSDQVHELYLKKAHIAKQKGTLKELNFLKMLIKEVEYSDFEKFIMHID